MRRVSQELMNLAVLAAFLVGLGALLARNSLVVKGHPDDGSTLGILWPTWWGYIKGLNLKGASFKEVLQAGRHSVTLLALALGLALPLGIFAGMRGYGKGKAANGSGYLSMGLQALPEFLVILIIQYLIVASHGRWGVGLLPVLYKSDAPLLSLVVPVLSLALVPAGFIARLTGQRLRQIYGQDYIRTARGKGLDERKILRKHALKNLWVYLLDGLPGLLTTIAANLLLVELLYNYPGLSFLIYRAGGGDFANADRGLRNLPDLPTLAIAGLAYAMLFLLLYGLSLILRRLIDPRLKEGGHL